MKTEAKKLLAKWKPDNIVVPNNEKLMNYILGFNRNQRRVYRKLTEEKGMTGNEAVIAVINTRRVLKK